MLDDPLKAAVCAVEPAVAILDLSVPVANGFHTCREILRVSPVTKVIMLTLHNDGATVLKSLRSGAKGYVDEAASPAELAYILSRTLFWFNVRIAPSSFFSG